MPKKKPNPISNPEDKALYLHNMKVKAGQAAAQARMLRKLYPPKAELVPAKPMEDLIVAPPVRKKKYRRTAKGEIEFGGFKPWMQRYALWLVQQESPPPIQILCKQASAMACITVTPHFCRLLLRRKDMQDCIESYQTDIVARSVADYKELFPKIVEIQRVQLDQALERRDFKGISKIIESGMDRLLPKKVDRSDVPKEIHIHVGGRQEDSKLMRAAYQEIEIIPGMDMSVTKVLPAGEPHAD